MTAVALPLCRFLFAALTIAVGRGKRVLLVLSALVDAALISQLCGVLRHGACSVAVGGWGEGWGIVFAVDRISVTFAALAFALSIAASLYTWKEELRPYFFMLLHLLVGACYALSFTKDLFNAYVLFELATLASFLLVGYDRRPRQIWASLRYLIFSSFGLSLFLLGVAVVYSHVETLNLDRIASAVASAPGAPWVALAGTLLVAGIAIKAGVFTFSLWLPEAHSQAPPAVSALLSGLVIKMGVVELFRLSAVFPLRLPLTVLGGLTGILGIVYAWRAYDVKRMLAFHTLSQIGYLLIGFGAGTEAARLGALDYAVAHGLFKALLFLAAGELAAAAGSSRLDRWIARRGELPRGARVALAIGMVGILGVPPFSGFAAKAVLEAGISQPAVRVVVFLISAGTALSFAKLIPVLTGRSSTRSSPARATAYGLLGSATLLFLPISRVMAPASVWAAALHGRAVAESLGAVAVGLLLYLALRRRSVTLPERVFRLEEGILIVLAGFFLVWTLLAFA